MQAIAFEPANLRSARQRLHLLALASLGLVLVSVIVALSIPATSGRDGPRVDISLRKMSANSQTKVGQGLGFAFNEGRCDLWMRAGNKIWNVACVYRGRNLLLVLPPWFIITLVDLGCLALFPIACALVGFRRWFSKRERPTPPTNSCVVLWTCLRCWLTLLHRHLFLPSIEPLSSCLWIRNLSQTVSMPPKTEVRTIVS